MVKFNKFSHKPIFESEDISPESLGLDWQQLLVDFQNKPVDETIKGIIEKFMVKENVEFDQICLILKHYILLNPENSENSLPYLDHFLQFDEQVYINQLVERFMNLGNNSNSQWMITEIIKLISSVCNEEQAILLLRSPHFSKFLLSSIFDSAILAKLKSNSTGFTTTEAAILTNLFETISSLCEIKSELLNFVTQTHVDWLADALTGINKTHTDLSESIARLFHLIATSETLNQSLGDLFINKKFFLNSIEYLSTNENQTNDLSANLNAKLYLMGSMANILNFSKNQTENKTAYFLNLLRDFGPMIQFSLDLNLNQNLNQETENLFKNTNSDADNETKTVIKSLEKSSESKILSLDILSTILNHFIQDNSEEEEYESWDECSDDGMDDNNNVKSEMDVEIDKTNQNDQVETQHISELKEIVKSLRLMDLLVKTISKDNENILQENDRIEHIYNSVKLIRNEALKTYLLLIETFYLNKKLENLELHSDIDISSLFTLLELLGTKSVEDLEMILLPSSNKKDESIVKFVEIIYDLFVYFNQSNVLTYEHKVSIVNLIKDILLKFKFDIIELSVRLARILGLISIKERDSNLSAGKDLLQLIGTILMELTVGSFELADQNNLETLRLNAELMDVIIDLFGEDNLGDLERNLNFIERIKYFNEKFYAKYKKIGKKQKIDKDHSLIIKTVKDNFKSFVDYKIKNSK
ncbi:unnamed protein product [Brachionus calyciflorus]|uniref:Uncharacterized protein n=1 Tax=Brachionus calyciflorus TaxID=104777 RepID=A0A813LYQ0_9BILA|nr:unnamed protein product [Brachionus calyciflorus]